MNYYEQKIADGLIDAPEETPEILEEQQQIWEYIPLVRKLASSLVPFCNLTYMDLCQQGYLILAELTTKIDWQLERGKITSYVKQSVGGLMKTYIGNFNTAVSVPKWHDSFYSTDIDVTSLEATAELLGEDDNPEEQLLLKERKDQLRGAVAVILPSLNEREFYVLFNCMLSDSPLSVREVASQFDCGKSSIDRDITRLKGRLKGVLNEDTQA